MTQELAFYDKRLRVETVSIYRSCGSLGYLLKCSGVLKTG